MLNWTALCISNDIQSNLLFQGFLPGESLSHFAFIAFTFTSYRPTLSNNKSHRRLPFTRDFSITIQSTVQQRTGKHCTRSSRAVSNEDRRSTPLREIIVLHKTHVKIDFRSRQVDRKHLFCIRCESHTTDWHFVNSINVQQGQLLSFPFVLSFSSYLLGFIRYLPCGELTSQSRQWLRFTWISTQTCQKALPVKASKAVH